MQSSNAICPEVCPLGLGSVIVRYAWTASPQVMKEVQNFRHLMIQAQIAGIQEVATALASVIVTFDSDIISRQDVIDHVHSVIKTAQLGSEKHENKGRVWHIPVAFGDHFGPQLAQAAEMANLTPAQAIHSITTAPLQVLSIGFAPGQPYIGLLDENWNLPRQPDLTPQVPAGALVVAVRQLVLFANDSATGWRQIGYCGFRPFWRDRQQAFALAIGDQIKFHAVGVSEMDQISANNHDGLGAARCEVLP